MIPYGRQEVTEADIRAVEAVLRSDFLTQGPAVPHFERVVARTVGARHAVAMNSATSALHAACAALGVESGDLVWTSPITFVATANCARYCGAEVDWVDIDPETYNLSPIALEQKLITAAAGGRLPKVVIPVHLAGQSCDMQRIHALGARFGFRIIEDASHAIGGSYAGKAVGSCEFSDITVFSFHPVKIITTGEGGMALTNDDALAERMALLRVHGITRDPERMTSDQPDGPWYYEQTTLGYNYRMTDIQAALGISQMARLAGYVEQRNAIADRYDEAFDDLPLTTPHVDGLCTSAFHLYVIRIQTPDAARHRALFERLRDAGIGVNLHYIPVYRQPDFVRQCGPHPGLPEAEAYYASAISLPMFPTLSEEDLAEVVRVVRREMGKE
ncbi:MAG: UDP-4-amino-4,6-dideoxy-N-acetyl-beta-L-altrosamine transaminase [Gemmatimonadales bacterium]|nr:MAG: UDP-4-amino-4,6-dideoxy-N-acetyl-beta-L-altrosamine transaminase [Gemmatimonadales bacterium]